MKNHMACFSPDNQYIAVAAFMSSVGIWKINLSKEGSFLGVPERHFTQLRGHESAILWVAFTSDSKRVVTSGKDGTWKLWTIDVNYSREETPTVLLSANHPLKGSTYNFFAISPDDSVLATAGGKLLHFWDLNTATLIANVDSTHFGYITEMSWSHDSQRLATSATDGNIRIFKNPTTK